LGEICDCITNWHYRGQKHETRAARKDRSGHRPIHGELNTIECRHDGLHDEKSDSGYQGKAISGFIAADDHELRECDGSGGKVSDADWQTIVAGRARPSGRYGIRRGRWASFKPEPLKTISRERYATDQATVYVFDTNEYVRQRLSRRLAIIATHFRLPPECIGVDENPYRNGGRRLPKSHAPIRGNASAVGLVGYLAKETDLRAMRRLAKIGRQKYAQGLVEKKGATIVLFTSWRIPPQDYIAITSNPYSPSVNTADTAEPPADSKDKPATAPLPPPLVWDERDRFGNWRRRSTLLEEHETSKASANRRMASLAVAVDNGERHGEQQHGALQPGSNLHRADGGHHRNVRQERRATR
jgi:hypothetical protein